MTSLFTIYLLTIFFCFTLSWLNTNLTHEVIVNDSYVYYYTYVNNSRLNCYLSFNYYSFFTIINDFIDSLICFTLTIFQQEMIIYTMKLASVSSSRTNSSILKKRIQRDFQLERTILLLNLNFLIFHFLLDVLGARLKFHVESEYSMFN